MDGTIIGQGSFVQGATAVNQYLVIPSNVDSLEVWNYTQAGGTADQGYHFYWQRGNGAVVMGDGTQGIVHISGAMGAVSVDQTAVNAFVLYDPSGQAAGALPLVSGPVATTASTNATRPVVSTADTSGLAVGSVVRMSATAQTDVNGIDMVVGAVTTNVSFTLLTATNPLANVPGAIGGAGFYRIVNTSELFYPRRRFIVDITNAANAQVSTSVAHGMTPGQEIRFHIPAEAGMVELDGLSGVVLSVIDDYNFTVDVNTVGFSAFSWPTISDQPSDFPHMVPFGEDTGTSLITPASQVPTVGGVQIYNTNSGILADSTVNTGFLGMILAAGSLMPAGSASDVVFWVARKASFGGL